jgi:hydrogenase nickel incorporation protein HypA/HybF
MHELSVATSLLRMVERHAREQRAARVLRVHVQLGEQCGVEAELLRSAWARVCEGGAAAGAELALQVVPVRWECRACGAPAAPAAGLRCAKCGEPATLAAGLELLLERIEMEVDGRV